MKLSFTFCGAATFQQIFSSRLANSFAGVGSHWFNVCLTADPVQGVLSPSFVQIQILGVGQGTQSFCHVT